MNQIFNIFTTFKNKKNVQKINENTIKNSCYLLTVTSTSCITIMYGFIIVLDTVFTNINK